MDREEANLPPPPPPTLHSSSSSSRPPQPTPHAAPAPSSLDFLRQVQAACKRIRPHDKIQSSGLRARRILVPGIGVPAAPLRDSNCDADLTVESDNSLDVMSREVCAPKDIAVDVAREDSGLIQRSIAASTVTSLYDDNVDAVLVKNDMASNRVIESRFLPMQIQSAIDFQKKDECPSIEDVNLQRAYERMATRMDDLPSHLGSLALTEMEWNGSNRMETSAVSYQDPKQHGFHQMDTSDASLKSDGGVSTLLAKRKNILGQDQNPKFPAILAKEIGHPITQSSFASTSCATTTSVHSKSAPLLNYTTFNSRPSQESSSHMEIEPLEECNVNRECANQLEQPQPSYSASQCTSAMSTYQSAAATQVSISSIEIGAGLRSHGKLSEQQGAEPKEGGGLEVASANQAKGPLPTSKDKSTKAEGCSVDITSVQSQAPVTKSTYSDVKIESSKSYKSEKAGTSKGAPASRKKNYDPDLFFKVNGKLYQKLGKIGTGGSSEVYKVISADCTIYALKKIKLKGRDYSTAYGFCQEIEYLTRLKGKNNVIQLIDYETWREVCEKIVELIKANWTTKNTSSRLWRRNRRSYGTRVKHSRKWSRWTRKSKSIWSSDKQCVSGIEFVNKLFTLDAKIVTDKALLAEVLNGSKNVKDARIRDDGYIYMVLEYGEIDLAHMLSQLWKETDGSNWHIGENWLRFYWQQILQAVNTIHEERIVHSDLKPANFLLVRGYLKLIDFGIAKAIMSDTTNIQRDSQVGTLSYMSPEAFMCNENDANGNPIKCGRPSDIWSLGCILYQMVYGRTPFADYKTFWAKFKVITDRNHEIKYDPVSNPWLLDLMKKCLAWDRNERWRIPQLLQHPFLVPPLSLPSRSLPSQDQGCLLLQIIAEAYKNDDESSRLCFQLQQLLAQPVPHIKSGLSTSVNQHCELLSQLSNICSQLEQHLTNLGKEGTLSSR
ncbi:hypothetical protein Sjap_018248 [Stephania japonica]|uniref:Protein kinase domain-containing protein n=1 Tax=Stephania japonica TaxID=461633 RepID=A0AAP0I7M6_9MAGN